MNQSLKMVRRTSSLSLFLCFVYFIEFKAFLPAMARRSVQQLAQYVTQLARTYTISRFTRKEIMQQDEIW